MDYVSHRFTFAQGGAKDNAKSVPIVSVKVDMDTDFVIFHGTDSKVWSQACVSFNDENFIRHGWGEAELQTSKAFIHRRTSRLIKLLSQLVPLSWLSGHDKAKLSVQGLVEK